MKNFEKNNTESGENSTSRIVELIESGNITRAMELFSDESDQSAVAEKLLETEEGEREFLRSLPDFFDLNTEVASKLAEKGHSRLIAQNPSAFSVDNHNEIGRLLMEAKQGAGLTLRRTEGWQIDDFEVKEYLKQFSI